MNLKKEFEKSTDHFAKSLTEMPEEYFNRKKNGESWSAGEIADHILKTEKSVIRLILGKTENVGRKPDKKFSVIKDQFLDFSKKFNAFGPILPDDRDYNKQETVKKFTTNRKKYNELFDSDQNLDLLCIDFKHPLFGHLTKREWIYFNIIHSSRHKEQIKKLKDYFIGND